jgi:hypothetical protein
VRVGCCGGEADAPQVALPASAGRARLAQAMLRDPDNFDRIVPDGTITCR